jgi:hypothetical protein
MAEHNSPISSAPSAFIFAPATAQSVAEFYTQVIAELAELDLHIHIDRVPNEIPGATSFEEDRTHTVYDPEYAQRFWRVLLRVDRVFKHFRIGFLGKVSPVHMFWESFDMAVTRFSGRRAPQHPGGVPSLPDAVTREAYPHQVSSAGFWPGGDGVNNPAFYSYAYPIPAGFDSAPVQPRDAFYHKELGEFILPYDAVRNAKAPDEVLLEFLQSTYEAAAETGGWDRASLERLLGEPGVST